MCLLTNFLASPEILLGAVAHFFTIRPQFSGHNRDRVDFWALAYTFSLLAHISSVKVLKLQYLGRIGRNYCKAPIK